MENNFDNMPEEQKQTGQNSAEGTQSGTFTFESEKTSSESAAQNTENNVDTGSASSQYTDPNAGTSYQQPYNQYTSAGTGGYSQYTSANSGNYNQNQSYGYQQNEQSYANYQQQYQDNYNYNVNTPSYNQSQDGQDTTPLSMGEWLLTLILLAIPCLNIVLYIVWAFGKNGNVNRRNYCRAGLILAAIGYVIAIIAVIIIAVAGGIGGYYYY